MEQIRKGCSEKLWRIYFGEKRGKENDGEHKRKTHFSRKYILSIFCTAFFPKMYSLHFLLLFPKMNSPSIFYVSFFVYIFSAFSMPPFSQKYILQFLYLRFLNILFSNIFLHLLFQNIILFIFLDFLPPSISIPPFSPKYILYRFSMPNFSRESIVRISPKKGQ